MGLLSRFPACWSVSIESKKGSSSHAGSGDEVAPAGYECAKRGTDGIVFFFLWLMLFFLLLFSFFVCFKQPAGMMSIRTV